MGVGGERHAPVALPPVPFVQEARWTTGLLFTCAENVACTGVNPRALQLYLLSYPGSVCGLNGCVFVVYAPYSFSPVAVRTNQKVFSVRLKFTRHYFFYNFIPVEEDSGFV